LEFSIVVYLHVGTRFESSVLVTNVTFSSPGCAFQVPRLGTQGDWRRWPEFWAAGWWSYPGYYGEDATGPGETGVGEDRGCHAGQGGRETGSGTVHPVRH